MKILDVNDFKEQLKLVLKPIRFKAFSVGPKFTNSVLTELGLILISLLWDKHVTQAAYATINLFLQNTILPDCFLYTVECQNLYNQNS